MAENILSIFIDESGDFGPYASETPFYIVAMVLHNQSINICPHINKLDEHLVKLEHEKHPLHIGPLIRKEKIYIDQPREHRKKLFNAMFHFARTVPFEYICAIVDKKDCADKVELNAKLTTSIAKIIQAQSEYLRSFDKIIIYYDNGQTELTHILTTLFNTLFFNVEFRKVFPSEYKLFQVADLICTMELINEKIQRNRFSHSEKDFFESTSTFKKNYYKSIACKRL